MRRSTRQYFAAPLLGALFATVLTAGAAMAQVTIDGTTSTTVVINPSGSVTVGVAPGGSNGVSLNRYDTFNVPKPGLKLDNSNEAARTIVNEVTGTSKTRIEGPVEVLGQRAHVIVANPNGIAIEDGRFINTGRVALTTGSLSLGQRQIAPGIFQDNVVSTVRDGTITVSGGGLSGQMDAVDIYAHTIRVTGPITNTSTADNASIRLSAGQQSVEFDSSVLPGNTDLSWGNILSADATSEGAVLIEISTGGVLRANRIGIEVSDKGAGVRIAADGFATSRSFSVTADGKVNVTNASIQAQGGAFVRARELEVTKSTISAPGSVISLEATQNSITATDSVFEAQEIAMRSGADLQFTRSALTADAGSVQLDAVGAFSATGTQVLAFGNLLVSAGTVDLANTETQTQLNAQNGSLILTTLDGDLVNKGALIQGAVGSETLTDGAGTAADGAVTLNVAGQLINTTTDELAVIFGGAGDVSIRTGATFENNRGRVLANGDVRLISAGDILNMVEADPKALTPEVVSYTKQGRRQWWTLFIKRKQTTGIAYDYGVLDRPDTLASITAVGNTTLRAEGAVINQGGAINANDGDLSITALRVQTVGLGSGKVSVRKTCVLTCGFEGEGNVTFYGGQLNASNDLTIAAAERFTNTGGAVFAFNDLEIVTPSATLEAVLVPTLVERPKGLYNFWRSKAAWTFLRDQFGTLVAETGDITVKSDAPLRRIGATVTAGGAINLESGETIVRAPASQSNAPNHIIGLFGNTPLLRQNR